MKKLIKFIILFTGLFTISSCVDELDQQPHDSITPDLYFNTIQDFKDATMGIYAGFVNTSDGGGYYDSSMLTVTDIMTDNVILSQAGRLSNKLFHEWRYNPDQAWDVLYAPYVVINRANQVLDNIDKLVDGVEKNNFIGEARGARAIAMFDMLRVYCQIPTQSSGANNSLGLPINTGIDPSIQDLRPTVAESYQFVIDELEAARGLINVDNGSGRLNKNAINAMLSRVYLYDGDYDNVITAANRVSESIASINNFPGVWTDSNNDGVLFKIEQDQATDNFSIGVDFSQSIGNKVKAEYVIAYDMYLLYSNDDIRKTAYVMTTPDNNNIDINAIIKWFGEAGQNNGAVDPKVIRAAEVYLNKAEAYYMNNQEGMALSALDALRSKRYNNFVSGNESGTALLNAIKLERRLELFAEGHRFFDLKRWNEGINRSSVYGDFADGSGTPVPSAYQNLPAGDFRFQLPIPQREINIFPEFQQNPGY